MIRKLVKQGPSTLTVSLPKRWIDRFSLKSGDEVNIDEGDSNLIISGGKRGKAEPVVFDFADVEHSLIKSITVGMYKNGLREVKIINVNPEKIKEIKRSLGSTMGFEILESSKDSISIMDLGTSDEESLRRAEGQIYWKLTYMIDELSDPKSTLESVNAIDTEINKLAFFIQRNLKAHFANNPQNFLIYEKIGLLESLGDALCSKGLPEKIVANKETGDYMKSIIDKFRSIQSKRDHQEFVLIDKMIKELRKKTSGKGVRSKEAFAIIENTLHGLLQINVALYLDDFKK